MPYEFADYPVDDPADNYVPDEPSGYYPDPLNEQKGFGSGAGADVVTDPSGEVVGTPGTIAGLKDFLGPYKSLFNKIKSGQAGATEYAAAAGILGLLIPSLNQPKTKGWKGSIDLNRQFTRTPIAQPAYTPYAQSAAPVMGRQFFNSTYGAPVTTGGTLPPVTTPPINPDAPLPGSLVPQIPPPDSSVNIATDGGGMAQGGIAEMAKGGRANRPRYLRGETDGMQDRIPSNIDGVQPAKLSHGEFVIPADVVSHLGNGNSDAGAKVLYKMMDRVRHARTGNKKQAVRSTRRNSHRAGLLVTLMVAQLRSRLAARQAHPLHRLEPPTSRTSLSGQAPTWGICSARLLR